MSFDPGSGTDDCCDLLARSLEGRYRLHARAKKKASKLPSASVLKACAGISVVVCPFMTCFVELTPQTYRLSAGPAAGTCKPPTRRNAITNRL